MLRFLVRHWRLIVLGLVFWVIAFRCIPKEFIELSGDSAQYIAIAESIAQGQGLRMVNYPGSPESSLAPLFSLLLAPIIYFFGKNVFLMHVFLAVISYAALLVIYSLFARIETKTVAFVCVTLLFLSRLFFSYQHQLLTEIPFLCVSFLAFFTFLKYKESPAVVNKEGVFCVILLIITYLTRYVGALVFLACAIDLILQNKNREAAVQKRKKILFLSAFFLPIWLFWNIRAMQIRNPYVDSFITQLKIEEGAQVFALGMRYTPALLGRCIEGVNFYFYLIGEALFPFWLNGRHASAVENSILLLVLTVVIWGVWIKIKKREFLFSIYLLAYFVFLVLWPYYEDGRYLLPVLPCVFFYFLIGIKNIFLPVQKFLIGRLGYSFLLVAFITGSILFSPKARYTALTFQELPQALQHFISLQLWCNKYIRDQGIIVSRKPTVTYFYTGHQSIAYPPSRNPEEIWQFMRLHKISYIIVDEFFPETKEYLLPFVYAYKERLRLLHRIDSTVFFEVVNN